MSETIFALKGAICYSKNTKELVTLEQGYIICEDGCSKGVFKELPEQYKNIKVIHMGNQLIIPGLVDLHVHAPQYGYRGLGMDLELMEWLTVNTFPEEAKFKDLSYAKEAYSYFVEDLFYGATTRASIYATLHVKAADLLMSQLENAGLATYVGKVNMDRNSPEYLCEDSAKRSLDDTIMWIEETQNKYKRTKTILTPRFIPTCSDELMSGLKKVQMEYNLPLQSHLSENSSEIKLVQILCPDTKFYGEAYHKFGLFGGDCPTIMAHCVHSSEEEIALMKNNGVYLAHCPQSNANLSSGIAPVRMFLDEGLNLGLGSDVAGGSQTSIFQAMKDAIQVSKLRYCCQDNTLHPLTVEEVFYMATKGGGSFFGIVGSFEKGYEFDAVVLNDENLKSTCEFTIKNRLERMIYFSDDRNIVGKYVKGTKLF